MITTATSPLSLNSSIKWDEKTINEQGMRFLRQKKASLKSYQNSWKAAQELDSYSSSSKSASEKFKVSAEQSIKEIKVLNSAVIELLVLENSKNALSERAKQLSTIAEASQHGLNYFTSVADDTCYPTHFYEKLKELRDAVLTFAFYVTIGRGVAYFLNYTPPSYALIAWKTSLVASVLYPIISDYYTWLMQSRIDRFNNLFEKALGENSFSLLKRNSI